jgi:putative ABC transport system substrate-binding protein
VRLNVDLIAVETTPASLAAKQATTTIPIVMTIVADPVANGLVRSLARPGGNITGMSLQQTDLTAKRVQLLKEVVPTISRLGILWNPASPITRRQFAEAEAAARVLGLQVESLEVRTPGDFERAFRAATGAGAGALLVLDDFLLVIHHARITALAIKTRLPALSTVTEFAQAGLNHGTE